MPAHTTTLKPPDQHCVGPQIQPSQSTFDLLSFRLGQTLCHAQRHQQHILYVLWGWASMNWIPTVHPDAIICCPVNNTHQIKPCSSIAPWSSLLLHCIWRLWVLLVVNTICKLPRTQQSVRPVDHRQHCNNWAICATVGPLCHWTRCHPSHT